jgi:uncharacterized protein YjbI with pentapeptide repeats
LYGANAFVGRDVDQQREHALQTYFDQLSALLVDKQLKKLLAANQATVAANAPIEKGADASGVTEVVTATLELSIDVEAALNVVKARTLSLLRMFDEDIPRKASVLSFLSDADLLKQLDLDLSGIKLEGANLKKVNFSACNFCDANLQRADLQSANLSGANLQRADLQSANLNDANLSGTKLSGAILSGVRLWRAILSGADLNRAILSDADLNRAILNGANLSGAALQNAILNGANLSGAALQNANLSGANLSGANLSDANLISARLSNAILIGADFSGAKLIGAKFWDFKLVDTDLDRAKRDAVARIQSAENWQEANYDPEIRALLFPKETAHTAAKD